MQSGSALGAEVQPQLPAGPVVSLCRETSQWLPALWGTPAKGLNKNLLGNNPSRNNFDLFWYRN